MCRTKQVYDYTAGKRIAEPMVACSAHVPESLWKRLQAAKAHFGIDGVVFFRDALDAYLTSLGF
jgi:hypothetical protein